MDEKKGSWAIFVTFLRCLYLKIIIVKDIMLILQQERATHLSVVVWLGASRSGIRPERGQPPTEEGGD